MTVSLPHATPERAALTRGARFGMLCSALGLDAGPLAPLLARMGPELQAGLSLRMESRLADCALVLRGGAEGFAERLWEAALALGCSAEASWFHQALSPGPAGASAAAARATLCARLDGSGVGLSLELGGDDGPAWSLEAVLERLQRGPLPRLQPWVLAPLRALAGRLGSRCAALASESRGAGRVLRLGFALPTGAARASVPGVLEAVGVAAAQRHYYINTLDALVPGEAGVQVWLAAEDAGVLAEVGVVYRAVPLPLILPIWRRFHPLPDLGQRLGALAGAAGTEEAAAFEIRYGRSDPPQLAVVLDVR